ncbi:isoleucine--tRNA ligase [Candidatus Saccharibacteria bacterium]|nr:isoleucine--tRNA ligase [Candidatus Saccharibacteria bacterium]
MKYKAGERRRALEYEKAVLEFWKKDKTFEKSVENRDVDKSYVFYDGPPFITGNPHHGTLLSSIVKDAVPRFWTMKGYRVERRWGWDCHGLPAENFVEKQLGITDRRQIGADPNEMENAISLESYITKARESMVANSETWEGTIARVGRWVDFKGAYRTMDKDFMESVWWAFKTLYEKGKIYEGRKVLMYDTKFCTPVSKVEVTMDNDAYQEVTDPSAFVLFRASSSPLFLLAWTTTPWTLPANLALAVNPKLEYGIYDVEGKKVILANKLAGKVLGEDIKPEQKIKGSELVGMEYEPIIETVPAKERKEGTYKVHGAEFVSSEDGTGIVHIAPAYGEDDYALGTAEDVDFVDCLDENGYYLPEVAEKLHELGVHDTDENGIEIWAGNKFIAKILEEKGIVYKIEYIKHEYPFNPRSKQRIMYRAFPSWFFDVQGSKPLMLEENENINWFPEYLKHGRFEKNIEAAPDWNLSRDRFWATAMPVWKGDKGTVKVVGSYDELFELSGVRLDDYHRPWVDEIEFDIDGEHFKRIEKVLDCWFESGSMPFAQLHYPFENKEKFEKNYPADFIVEYVGQVRAWFYYVHVVNTALFGHNAYKNVITTGTLAGNDGRKMSKSLGNYTDPNELMDKFSADSLRFLLLSSPVLAGEDFALLDKDVSDVARKLSMIWNTYDFFTMYAEVDRFDSSDAISPSKFENPLDKWIVSRVYQVRNEITEGMEEYNIPKAVEGILPFVDDLSNWFVRRSRRRFWKAQDDSDKLEAYSTLYFVLVYLSQILAPFTPFLAEELYQKMTGSTESVHLLDWPEADKIDEKVLAEMERCREVITEGLALRMQKSDQEDQIKVRQPLSELVYDGEKLSEYYEQIIMDEVNVKRVTNGKAMKLDKELTEELKAEGFARELIRFIQAGRKKAGLNVDDRIRLSVSCFVPDDLKEMIKNEVLAVEFTTDVTAGNFEYDEIVKIEDENVTISLEKA